MSDLNAARRSLLHLLVGRALGVGVGLGVLALLWRRVPTEGLGHYLTLLALLEALYLASGLGLSTVIQREWPQWWAAGSTEGRLGGSIMRANLGIITLRLASALCVAWALWGTWPWVCGVLKVPMELMPPALFVLWALMGSASRCMEEMTAALMMQDAVQSLAVGGQLLRALALMGALGPDFHAEMSSADAVRALVTLDLTLCACAAVVGMALLMRRMPKPKPKLEPQREPDPRREPNGDAPNSLSLLKGWKVGLRFWWVQLLGLSFGTVGMRLVVSHLGGPLAVAVLGAAQSVADAVRNALPITVLSGWLRPVMLRLHLQASTSPTGADRDLAMAVFKLSVMALAPWLATALVAGGAWMQGWAGASWMAQAQVMSLSSPALDSLLWPALLSLALLQSAHLAVSLQCTVRGEPGPALWATACAALLAVPVAVMAWPFIGLWGAVLGLIVAEAAWVGVAEWGLAAAEGEAARPQALMSPILQPLLQPSIRRPRLRDAVPMGLLMLGAVMGAFMGALISAFIASPASMMSAPIGSLIGACMATLAAGLLLRPISGPEWHMLTTHLPAFIRRAARRLLGLIKLMKVFASDAWSYAQGSGLIHPSAAAAQAHLLKTAHRIDKGLALPTPRPGFGAEALQQLDRDLQQLKQHHGPPWAWDAAVQTLQRYRLQQSGTTTQEVDRLLDKWSRPESLERHPEGPQSLGPRTEQPLFYTREELHEQARGTFESLIRSRRSIRQFSGGVVARGAIEEAVWLASHSPSVCNRSGTRVWVAHEEHTRKLLLRHQNGHHGFADRASALLVVSVRPEVFHTVEERHQGWIDGGLFAMTLILSLHRQGLGTCCLNWCVPPDVDAAFKREAGLPRHEMVVMLLAVGTLPETLRVASSPRRPLAELLSWLDAPPKQTRTSEGLQP